MNDKELKQKIYAQYLGAREQHANHFVITGMPLDTAERLATYLIESGEINASIAKYKSGINLML